VVLTDADFKHANVKASETIEIQTFCDAGEIPAAYYEKPYYLSAGKGGAKVYTLKATDSAAEKDARPERLARTDASANNDVARAEARADQRTTDAAGDAIIAGPKAITRSPWRLSMTRARRHTQQTRWSNSRASAAYVTRIVNVQKRTDIVAGRRAGSRSSPHRFDPAALRLYAALPQSCSPGLS
jgi:hypothetical protein